MENFMCMGRVNSQENPYVFTSKVDYYIIDAHLLCTNYINKFFLLK